MRRILTLPGAEDDVQESMVFYAEEEPGIELQFESEVRQAYERIAADPDRWPLEFKKVRRFRMDRFPFAIFYVNYGEMILIIAVAHAKRVPGYWKSRMS